MLDADWVQPAALGGLLQRGNASGRALQAVCSPAGSHAFLSPSLAQSVSASPPESLQDEERTGGTGLKRKREEKDLPGHYVSAPKSVAVGDGPGPWRWLGSSVPAPGADGCNPTKRNEQNEEPRGGPSARGLSRCLRGVVLVRKK